MQTTPNTIPMYDEPETPLKKATATTSANKLELLGKRSNFQHITHSYAITIKKCKKVRYSTMILYSFFPFNSSDGISWYSFFSVDIIKRKKGNKKSISNRIPYYGLQSVSVESLRRYRPYVLYRETTTSVCLILCTMQSTILPEP